MNFFKQLQSRGLVAQCSDQTKIEELLNKKIFLYCGFDPTSDSLTVGNLLALVTLKRFSNAGHTPIILIGNFTSMIGDPTGRNSDRPILDSHTVHISSQKIALQSIKIVGQPFQIVFNGSFYETQSVLQFMRDIACNFSVNEILAKDSVQTRLASGGLTFSEMSYSLFQASDFDFLFSKFGCVLQIGGSDQWGNICAGIDLCRKRNHEVFGMTFPLVTKSDGTKFGKSSDGTIWLDPVKTSAWDFFQFWMNLPDDNVEHIFKMFSLKSDDFVNNTLDLHRKDKSGKIAQTALAIEMTELVHSQEDSYRCLNVARAMFQEDWESLTIDEFELASNVLGSVESEGDDVSVVSALIQGGLATSKSDANRLIASGGVSINEDAVKEPIVKSPSFFHGKFLILKKGKKSFKVIRKKISCAVG